MPRGRFVLRSVRARVLLAVLASILVIAGGATALLFRVADDHLNRTAARRLESFEQQTRDRLEQLERDLGLGLDLLLTDGTLRERFANRDRAALEDTLVPLFEQRLRTRYDVTQFHFHVPPATSFLRLHRPDRHGDDLSEWRQSLVLANTEQRAVSGIEVTRSGPGLKVIRPVRWQGRHIGTVELATSLDRTLDSTRESLDAFFALGIRQQTWSRARCDELLTPIARRDEIIFYHLSDPWLEAILNHAPAAGTDELALFSHDRRTIAARTFIIEDFTGQNVGELVAVIDVSEQSIALRRQFLGTLALIGLLAMIAAVTVGRFLRRALGRPLEACVVVADKVAEGDLRGLGTDVRDQIGDRPGRELDLLLEALERMRIYLDGLSLAATEVTEGRLTGTFEPASERDVLGHAFNRMLSDLRQAIQQLKEGVMAIQAATVQVAATGENVATNAESQSTASEQVSTSTGAMAAQLELVAASTADLSSAADTTREQLQEISADISDLIQQSEEARRAGTRTTETVGTMHERLEALDEQIERVLRSADTAQRTAHDGGHELKTLLTDVQDSGRAIVGFVQQIAALADQTNLLAINAAVEAERAGDAGRGFAVVAQSIRRVAERSKTALAQISAIADDVSNQTVAGIESSSTVLEQIAETTTQTTSMVAELRAGIEKQREGGQVVQAQAEESQRIVTALAAELLGHAKATADLAELMEAMKETTERVARSTDEQRQVGRQVATSSQVLSRLASQYRDAVEELVDTTEALKSRASLLATTAERFEI